MTLGEYFNKLQENLQKINANDVTLVLYESIKASFNITERETVICFMQVTRDYPSTELTIESLVATSNSVSDIIIGKTSLKFNTIPISKINKIAFEIIPNPPTILQTDKQYTVRLNINYGQEGQVFHYVASEDKFQELMKVRKELSKLIAK